MTLSQGMTYALVAALVALSAREALAPRTAARGYGIPIPEGIDATPYLEVKANRDFVLAGLLVVHPRATPFCQAHFSSEPSPPSLTHGRSSVMARRPTPSFTSERLHL